MPQVFGTEIKERAARLRAAGDEQVKRHLAAQKGRNHSILMESPRMGRTEGFAEVAFSKDQPVGQIVTTRIVGQIGEQLTA